MQSISAPARNRTQTNGRKTGDHQVLIYAQLYQMCLAHDKLPPLAAQFFVDGPLAQAMESARLANAMLTK